MRKPNIRSAAADFGFLAVSFIAGLAGAAWPVAVLLFVVATLTWWWTRRATLAQVPLRVRLTQSAIALLMLAGVMALFYWIGLTFGGHN
jgi:hypothetical protein